MLYDKDIREPLFYYLEERFGKSRILEELNIGRSRADVVMVLPQRIVGLEIKSNADTYDRLERQVKDYNKFCDSNYIVTGLRHVKHVAGHIPDYWGILCIYEDNRKVIIDEVRPATDNPSVLKASQMSWLWKNELSNILSHNQMPRYRQKSKSFICEKLLARVDWTVLKEQLCNELFERDYTLVSK